MRKLSNILLILLFPFFINCGKGIIALFEDTNNVKGSSVYVSIGGDDYNPGTLHSPLKTIQAGIDLAKEKSYANVLVTGGEYSSQGTVFTLPDQNIPNSLKYPFPFQFGVQFLIGLVFNFQ